MNEHEIILKLQVHDKYIIRYSYIVWMDNLTLSLLLLFLIL